MRTDIPAFYSEWLVNRIKEKYVLVRNPYNPSQVTKYSLSPDVVDLIAFCTKNPAPMLPYMDVLKPYGQYWFVTITHYGRDIESNVPDKEKVMESFRTLSDLVGVDSMGWRYDPILIDKEHSVAWHIREFEKMAAMLAGYTKSCIISFIDIYQVDFKLLINIIYQGMMLLRLVDTINAISTMNWHGVADSVEASRKLLAF